MEDNLKKYDLEERTASFAIKCRDFIYKLPKNVANHEYSKQLIRSSGSQAANYIEANEAVSKKDFVLRVKICKKETKESRLWLKLCDLMNENVLVKERDELLQESMELMKIFGAILEKSK